MVILIYDILLCKRCWILCQNDLIILTSRSLAPCHHILIVLDRLDTDFLWRWFRFGNDWFYNFLYVSCLNVCCFTIKINFGPCLIAFFFVILYKCVFLNIPWDFCTCFRLFVYWNITIITVCWIIWIYDLSICQIRWNCHTIPV